MSNLDWLMSLSGFLPQDVLAALQNPQDATAATTQQTVGPMPDPFTYDTNKPVDWDATRDAGVYLTNSVGDRVYPTFSNDYLKWLGFESPEKPISAATSLTGLKPHVAAATNGTGSAAASSADDLLYARGTPYNNRYSELSTRAAAGDLKAQAELDYYKGVTNSYAAKVGVTPNSSTGYTVPAAAAPAGSAGSPGVTLAQQFPGQVNGRGQSTVGTEA